MAGQPSSTVIAIPKAMRMEWTDAMAFDPALSPVAFRIACIIGAHFNRESGDTFISQQTIALLANKTDRTVRIAITELERLGYLEVKRRELGRRASDGRRVCGGKGVANTYMPTFERDRLNASDRGRRLLKAVEQRLSPAKEETDFPRSSGQRRKNAVAKEEASFLPTLGSNPINAGPANPDLGSLGDRLRAMIGEVQFHSWFREVRIQEVTDDTLRLSAPSKFTRRWLMENYREAIITCWQRLHSKGVVHLEITVPSLQKSIRAAF